MNRFRRIFNRAHNMDRKPSPAPTYSSNSPTESWTTHDSNLALLKCLSIPTPTRPALPPELILQIIDHPTRWAHFRSVSHPPSVDRDKPLVVVRNESTGIPILYTRPFTAREAELVRKIVFTFRSRDQGWSSHRDQGTWSWFDASLEQSLGDGDVPNLDGDTNVWTGSYDWVREWMQRHEKSCQNQTRYQIQKNKHAETTPEDYVIELNWEHELVQRVQEGDSVVLWGCACFPGWENRVYEAKISLFGRDNLMTEKEGTAGDES